jgi:hypothetical protein
MRKITKLLFCGALCLLAQGPLTEPSMAQSAGPDPRAAFSESIPFAGGYIHLQYLPQEKAINVRWVNSDGSGFHSYIGIGWSYFTTNVASAGGKTVKSSTDPLNTCLAAKSALLQGISSAISGQIGQRRPFGESPSPNFYRTDELVQAACQSVLPGTSVIPRWPPERPKFGVVPPQIGG